MYKVYKVHKARTYKRWDTAPEGPTKDLSGSELIVQHCRIQYLYTPFRYVYHQYTPRIGLVLAVTTRRLYLHGRKPLILLTDEIVGSTFCRNALEYNNFTLHCIKYLPLLTVEVVGSVFSRITGLRSLSSRQVKHVSPPPN